MTPQEQRMDTLQQDLCRVIVDLLAGILGDHSFGNLVKPVLRFETLIQDGEQGMQRQISCTPMISKILDLSSIISQSENDRLSVDNARKGNTIGQPTLSTFGTQSVMDGVGWPSIRAQRTPHQGLPQLSTGTGVNASFRRWGVSALRSDRKTADVEEEHPESQRHTQFTNGFPHPVEIQSNVVIIPQQSSIDRFVVNIWERIHGCMSLDSQDLLEQWQLMATAAKSGKGSIDAVKIYFPEQLGFDQLQASSAEGTLSETEIEGIFNRGNIFCRKITQISRACRLIEVIVQTRWIEHFDSYVELLAITKPSMSRAKRRKATLIKTCNDFGWSEKKLRNRMAIWRGYKDIKDAGGWAVLVFSGVGFYRFCKYRVGFDPDSMQRLRCLRPQIEVAADTLHPTWRHLLVIVGERTQRRFFGHPHDWVVYRDGSDPVSLRSTCLKYNPNFSFEQLEHSVIDMSAWGTDDPRWVPPVDAVACVLGVHTCQSCGREQSEDPKTNTCYCFPTLFGFGRRFPCPVQVFRTSDGRNNSLMALCPFERGAAIGEFVGLITRDLQNTDVMDSSTGGRAYQIWQGRQGNFTRFINHSRQSNAQFQQFVWMSTQRIILVSKGIEAGHEITVEYSEATGVIRTKDVSTKSQIAGSRVHLGGEK
ncbi:SET domain-containing protein [Colletotrichum abscissum]|uniref:SET domain-containing protein n=1 Tax=Colletotrichum abscissum TaxID=1671311 RepID=A0A9P9X2A3_9PEZI|nr:SET domain-containing protein [Colletotrichum abscissum]KAI3532115.1 SET domain-containing protein [Colletotrichum abscissum]KAK1517369.1 SET domain-containing protein [Colletotrichum abscissum]